MDPSGAPQSDAAQQLEALRSKVTGLRDKLSALVSDAVVSSSADEDVNGLNGPEPSATSAARSCVSCGDGHDPNRTSPSADNAGGAPRTKVAQMSSEVSATNPYSRLMALEKMGVVENYKAIRDKTVVIVGLGGVGAVVAEMLVRCGVGKLILFDYDHVELANMNRLFFRPEHCGLTKADAARQTLETINPDVEFEAYTYDVTSMDNFPHFIDRLSAGGRDGASQVDLVLSCVDNYAARMAINSACTEQNQTWLEAGVSEDAMSGHIQLMLPGRTACFACAPPLAVAEGSESSLKREGVCAASLPTTMAIVAGMLGQNALKILLGYGLVTYHEQYNALLGYHHVQIMYPNDACTLEACVNLQVKYRAENWQPVFTYVDPRAESEEPVEHADNEWNIEQVGEGDAWTWNGNAEANGTYTADQCVDSQYAGYDQAQTQAYGAPQADGAYEYHHDESIPTEEYDQYGETAAATPGDQGEYSEVPAEQTGYDTAIPAGVDGTPNSGEPEATGFSNEWGPPKDSDFSPHDDAANNAPETGVDAAFDDGIETHGGWAGEADELEFDDDENESPYAPVGQADSPGSAMSADMGGNVVAVGGGASDEDEDEDDQEAEEDDDDVLGDDQDGGWGGDDDRGDESPSAHELQAQLQQEFLAADDNDHVDSLR